MSARSQELAIPASREVALSHAERKELEQKITPEIGKAALELSVESPLRTVARHDIGEEAVKDSDMLPAIIESPDAPAVSGVSSEVAILPLAPLANEMPALPPAEEGRVLSAVPEKAKPIVVGEVRQGHDAERKAHELTDRLIESKQEQNSKRKFYNPKKLARTIWSYDKNRRKYLENARRDIQASGSLHGADSEWTDEQRMAFKDAEINRLIHGVDEAVDTHAGENRDFFEDDHEIAVDTKTLMSEFAGSSEMTDDQFNEKMAEIRAKMAGDQDEMHMSNYLEVARAIRGRIEQGEAMDDVLEGFRVVRAESRSDVRSEIHKTKLDELYDKYEQSKFGQIMPASVLAVGVGAGLFIAERGAKSTALKVGTLGASAGLIGAMSAAKAHAQSNRQRSTSLAEKARGKEYGEGNKRIEKISAYDYEQISSDSLIGGLTGLNERFKDGEVDGELAGDALNKLADLRAIKAVSAMKGIELIDVGVTDDPNKRSKDRLAMATESAQLKAYLADMVKSGDSHALEVFGLDPATDVVNLEPEHLDELINHAIDLRSETFANTYTTDITAKDKAWAQYNMKDAAKQGAKAAAISLAMGGIMQEVAASFSDNRAGLLEKAWGAHNNANAHNTILNFGEKGYSTEHIDTLTDQQKSEIRAGGGTVTDTPGSVESKIVGSRQSVRDFLTDPSNKNNVRHFNTVNSYTNDTAQSDLNELGGMMTKNTDGSIKVWADMTKDGSFNADGSSIDMARPDSNGGTKVFTIMVKEPDGSYLSRNYTFGQNVEPPLSNLLQQNSDGSFSVKGGENVTVAWGTMTGDKLDVAASLRGSGEPVMLDTSKAETVTKPGGYDVTRPTDRQVDGTVPVWLKGSSAIGTAQRPASPKPVPSPPPKPTPLTPRPTEPSKSVVEKPSEPGKEVDTIQPVTPEDNTPRVRELERVPGKGVELASRPEDQNQPSDVLQSIESKQRQVAREAGWIYDDIRIAADQDVSAETWQDATKVMEAAQAEYPDVTDPVERLRMAIKLIEETGAFNNPETRDLLDGLLRMNERQSGEEAPRQEAPPASSDENPTGTSDSQEAPIQSSAGQKDGAAPNSKVGPEDMTAEGQERLNELSGRIDGIMSISGKEAEKYGVTEQVLDSIRDRMSRAIMERGPQISNATLRKVVLRDLHPDSERHGDRDSNENIFKGTKWLLERMQ